MQEARQSVMVVRQVLNKKPIESAQNAISFLNSLIVEEIKKGNIKDRTITIMLARKVANKYQHLDTVQEKIDVMNH